MTGSGIGTKVIPWDPKKTRIVLKPIPIPAFGVAPGVATGPVAGWISRLTVMPPVQEAVP